MQSSQLPRNGLIWFLDLENLGIDTICIALACSLPPIFGKKGFLVMAALISILLEMPKGDAMSSSGFSIRTTWTTRICKEKNFISRIQVQPHGTRTKAHRDVNITIEMRRRKRHARDAPFVEYRAACGRRIGMCGYRSVPTDVLFYSCWKL